MTSVFLSGWLPLKTLLKTRNRWKSVAVRSRWAKHSNDFRLRCLRNDKGFRVILAECGLALAFNNTTAEVKSPSSRAPEAVGSEYLYLITILRIAFLVFWQVYLLRLVSTLSFTISWAKKKNASEQTDFGTETHCFEVTKFLKAF